MAPSTLHSANTSIGEDRGEQMQGDEEDGDWEAEKNEEKTGEVERMEYTLRRFSPRYRPMISGSSGALGVAGGVTSWQPCIHSVRGRPLQDIGRVASRAGVMPFEFWTIILKAFLQLRL